MGLTGPIGSGKTAVAMLLEQKGVHFIDSDEVARKVTRPGTPAYETLVQRFGTQVLSADGQIDRRILADIVFADPISRRDLESITHPDIFVEITWAAGAAVQEGKSVVVELPLLYDTPLDYGSFLIFDSVIGVTAPTAQRQERLVSRGMTAEQAQARMAAQSAVEERVAQADYLIENTGTRQDLADKVDKIWLKLQEIRSGG